MGPRGRASGRRAPHFGRRAPAAPDDVSSGGVGSRSSRLLQAANRGQGVSCRACRGVAGVSTLRPLSTLKVAAGRETLGYLRAPRGTFEPPTPRKCGRECRQPDRAPPAPGVGAPALPFLGSSASQQHCLELDTRGPRDAPAPPGSSAALTLVARVLPKHAWRGGSEEECDQSQSGARRPGRTTGHAEGAADDWCMQLRVEGRQGGRQQPPLAKGTGRLHVCG